MNLSYRKIQKQILMNTIGSASDDILSMLYCFEYMPRYRDNLDERWGLFIQNWKRVKYLAKYLQGQMNLYLKIDEEDCGKHVILCPNSESNKIT